MIPWPAPYRSADVARPGPGELFVQVGIGPKGSPSIEGAIGLAGIEMLQEVAAAFYDELFEHGPGDYLFEVTRIGDETEDGRLVNRSYLEFREVAFRKSDGWLKMLAPRPVETEAPFPFVRDQYEMPPPECDGDGDGNEPWPDPEIVACWRPGVREECEYDGGCAILDTHRDADGTGAILLTEFAAFRNAQGREMVTYKRRWRDPDGRVFGKGDYRVCSREKFDRMAKGYAFDFEVTG